MIAKNFFETNGTDLNDLNFCDRVNMYTKGGPTQGIKFNDYERHLLNLIEGTETYDEVLEVARLVCAHMEKQAEEYKEYRMAEMTPDEEGEEYDCESDSLDDYDMDEEGDVDQSQGNNDSNIESDNKIESSKESQVDAGGTESCNSDMDSITDRAYRRNESKLFANDSCVNYYGNIPDVDLNDAIVGHKQLWKRYRDSAEENPYSGTRKGIDTEGFMKLRNDSKKVVGYLSKEFELRKNADQLKRASIAKTGELNMNKIYSYQFTDDIFKKMTVIPGAKSHGLVMFLDWSGSMSNHMANTVKQLINLVMFCKKVNIPYEVYAFSQEYDNPYKEKWKEGDIVMHNFKLLNLLSSKMSAAEFTYAGSALVNSAQYRAWKPNWFQKGGTPLSEAVICAMKIIPEFQKNYKLQIVNTVFLTDGEGHSLNQVYYKDENRETYGTINDPKHYDSDYRKTRRMTIRDPITKHQESLDVCNRMDLSSAYIKMLKARTNCNIIGFYVLSGREVGREIYRYFPDNFRIQDKLKVEFRKNKSLTVTSAGFDEYYLLRSEGLDTDDDTSFEVKENATTRGLVSAFSKFTGNRLNNRVVLNRFIGLIS